MARKKKTPVNKKSPTKRQPASKGGSKMREAQQRPSWKSMPVEDQEKPYLEPVPDENKSFWRILAKEGKLLVKIKNHGGDLSDEVKVKVDFRGYGRGGNENDTTPEELPLHVLEKNQSKELKFDMPTDDSFDPDCEFDIIIDEGGDLEYFTSAICFEGNQ